MENRTPDKERSSYLESKKGGFSRIIQSDSYAGGLTVFLESGRGAGVFQKLTQNHPSIKIGRSAYHDLFSEVSPEKKRFDWDRVFQIEAQDKKEAEEIISELMETEGVSLVYPRQKEYGPHADGTPNLEGLQTYLEGPDRAGLNIRQAWDHGVYGAGVMIAVNDSGINFEHEEFDLNNEWVGRGGNNWGEGCDPVFVNRGDPSCQPPNVAHGTATTGIIHAQHGPEDDRHGSRGIAPNAWTTVGWWSFNDNAMPKGSIVLEECGTQFSWDGRVTCQEGHGGLGCVPCNSNPEAYVFFSEIDEVWEMLMVSTAGNGAINLDEVQLIDDETMEDICGGPRDDPEAAECWAGTDELMVGASAGDRGMVQTAEGLRPVKREFSNCGERVKAFGWGERVVTTTWRNANGAIPGYDWAPVAEGPTPPNADGNTAYTNQFGGTSAAAAMVAGAAVLVQSYFKDISNGTPSGDGNLAEFRYLTPKKIKEILYESGIEAVANDGCSIGRQPNIEGVLRLTREFWNGVIERYPELNTPEISEERMIPLHEEGVGLICKLGREENSDPACPMSIIDPPLRCEDYGAGIAKKMDLDADLRGDLVSWEPGLWRMDLSSVAPQGAEQQQPNDNYGAWDVELSYPQVSRWEVPVVEDYDSDGRADLAIYDRENGRWNIAVTNDETLQGQWHGWDYVVNWPAQPDNQTWDNEFYTRPLPADYNGDKWMDLAVQTSDGHWKINFGWRGREEWLQGEMPVRCRFEHHGPETPDYQENEVGRWTAPGVWDLAYLTEEELREYPGWAYIPFPNSRSIEWRGPDGVLKLFLLDEQTRYDYSDFGAPPFLGIEDIRVQGIFAEASDVVAKSHDGFWKYYSADGISLVPGLNGIFGGPNCKPMPANLDGDGFDEGIFDKVVQCPNEWRIVYSGNRYSSQAVEGVRRVPLGYSHPPTLPGQPIFGGLSYERVMQTRDFLRELNVNGVSPFFDYVMNPYEYCDLPWFVEDLPPECF